MAIDTGNKVLKGVFYNSQRWRQCAVDVEFLAETDTRVASVLIGGNCHRRDALIITDTEICPVGVDKVCTWYVVLD